MYDQQRELEQTSQQRERWMCEEHAIPLLEQECDGFQQELKGGYVLWRRHMDTHVLREARTSRRTAEHAQGASMARAVEEHKVGAGQLRTPSQARPVCRGRCLGHDLVYYRWTQPQA